VKFEYLLNMVIAEFSVTPKQYILFIMKFRTMVLTSRLTIEYIVLE